ncbi:sigma-70 family RNA polymerase sigma factor [Bhargavaea beijingensis]|uniref:sigma-70 family RNA polymerase sigma factor n=1 Tax=Bhargavaea beijingensis TaxID=426756 RepID=UPI0022249E76|nr:sigma-70 family RNA polymerase sigma factor [Bhargavaea beijingensis]MCW1928808.1 sigma-70 family RNA polymerase sigma factor [Bhargavaea beijingensis]
MINVNTEDLLLQYEPMISAAIRQLNIRRDHDNFRQAARLALCQACARYDSARGHFAPFAYRTIRGAMLDELKKESRHAESASAFAPDTLEALSGHQAMEEHLEVSDDRLPLLRKSLASLTEDDRLLLFRLFAERMPYTECARLAGISVPGIKKRRERILVRLRKQITAMAEEEAAV